MPRGANWERSWADLLAAIPATRLESGIEGQMRGVLDALIAHASGCDPAADPVEYPTDRCPSCGGFTSSERSPYCSPHCRESSAFVRRFRAALADRSLFDEDRQLSLAQAFWSLQGGGYPLRQLLVPPRAAERVIARDQGRCQVCGAPATGVDHIGSG